MSPEPNPASTNLDSPDGHPCSKCPLLDLGHVYPPRDPRDPWRRMPGMFQAAQRIFGGGMYRHGSKTRERAELLLGHFCRVNREKYGLCTRKRSVLCQRIALEALQHGDTAPTPDQRIAYAQAALKRAVNSEETHEALKATVIRRPANISIPPITFRKVPTA